MWNYSLQPYKNAYDFSQNRIISRIHDDEFYSMVNWTIEDENQAFREIWINRLKCYEIV